jgi:hypothetical protein
MSPVTYAVTAGTGTGTGTGTRGTLGGPSSASYASPITAASSWLGVWVFGCACEVFNCASCLVVARVWVFGCARAEYREIYLVIVGVKPHVVKLDIFTVRADIGVRQVRHGSALI